MENKNEIEMLAKRLDVEGCTNYTVAHFANKRITELEAVVMRLKSALAYNGPRHVLHAGHALIAERNIINAIKK